MHTRKTHTHTTHKTQINTQAICLLLAPVLVGGAHDAAQLYEVNRAKYNDPPTKPPLTVI